MRRPITEAEILAVVPIQEGDAGWISLGEVRARLGGPCNTKPELITVVRRLKAEGKLQTRGGQFGGQFQVTRPDPAARAAG